MPRALTQPACPAAARRCRSDLSCQHNACAAKLRGTVYPGLAWLGGLLKLNLGHNELGGRLPALWGRNGTWLSLVELDIHSNMVGGCGGAARGLPGLGTLHVARPTPRGSPGLVTLARATPAHGSLPAHGSARAPAARS